LVSLQDDDMSAGGIKSRSHNMYRFLCAGLAVITAVPLFAAAPVAGRWYTDGRDSIIEIGPCGAAVCGRVIKIIKVSPGTPAVPLDGHNPDPKLRHRPIQGLTILSGFTDTGPEWTGTIYDPRAGKSYNSKMKRLADGTLQVKGCWGPFCRTVIFTPVK
jgi:uncharacterized protein (DUF2147 family)